jgi:hypothetical protein
MIGELEIREIGIVVVAQNHNPTILNPDFLKFNEVVPKDWELAAPPICVAPVAKVTFKNGINIIAQFDKVIFAQAIQDKSVEELLIPKIARKYIETLPHVNYTSVGINPKGHIVFLENNVQEYLVKTFLANGPWREIGESPVKASLKLVYTLDRCKCALTIDEAILQTPEKPTTPALLFAANFHHDIGGMTKKEKLADLFQIIDNWKKDFEMFKNIVAKIMLERKVT